MLEGPRRVGVLFAAGIRDFALGGTTTEFFEMRRWTPKICSMHHNICNATMRALSGSHVATTLSNDLVACP